MITNDKKSIKLICFNVHHANDPYAQTDEEVYNYIFENKPDIIVFDEFANLNDNIIEKLSYYKIFMTSKEEIMELNERNKVKNRAEEFNNSILIGINKNSGIELSDTKIICSLDLLNEKKEFYYSCLPNILGLTLKKDNKIFNVFGIRIRWTNPRVISDTIYRLKQFKATVYFLEKNIKNPFICVGDYNTFSLDCYMAGDNYYERACIYSKTKCSNFSDDAKCFLYQNRDANNDKVCPSNEKMISENMCRSIYNYYQIKSELLYDDMLINTPIEGDDFDGETLKLSHAVTRDINVKNILYDKSFKAEYLKKYEVLPTKKHGFPDHNPLIVEFEI